MLSWHNDPELKAKTVEKMREHRRRDEIVQGMYQWKTLRGHKGCFIGCTLPYMGVSGNSRWHREVVDRYGIPLQLVYSIEHIFETLARGYAEFAVEVLERIPVGVDLDPVVDRLNQETVFNPVNARDVLFEALDRLTPKPEPVPPLIQRVDIPEPPSILIREYVNN